MTSVLPISNVINVTITTTPSGLTEPNVNTVALFTTETPSNVDTFNSYISASQVADDYGTSSITAQMANAVFAQTPNIRTGNGNLIIVPMQSAVSATVGDTTTADISANVADIILVNDGDLRVTVNGTDVDLTGLDFTNCTDLEDVALVIQKVLTDVIVTAPTASTLKFESKKVGLSSAITLGAVAGGTGTDLSGAGYFNASGAIATVGVNASGETLLDAIARVEDEVFFAGVMTNLLMEDATVVTTANGIQAMDRIFVHQGSSAEDIEGLATDISGASLTKTRILVYTEGVAEANLMKASYVGRAFSVNTRGSFTAQTMNLKSLATITADTGITQTIYDKADTAGADLYVSYAGVPSVYSTGGNDYFDNVYNDLALKFALETAGFNYLRQTNTKVPQTEVGMNGLKNAYAQVCERFIRNGAIAGGSWTSSETFGDPETFKQNVLEKGYYIYSLPITQQDASEREQRKAPLIQIAIKRAGAIHTSDVLVNVND